MHSYNRNSFERETHIGYPKTLHFNTKTTYLDSVIGTKAGTEQYKGGEGRVNKCAHSRMQWRSSKTKPSRSFCTFKCNQSKQIRTRDITTIKLINITTIKLIILILQISSSFSLLFSSSISFLLLIFFFSSLFSPFSSSFFFSSYSLNLLLLLLPLT